MHTTTTLNSETTSHAVTGIQFRDLFTDFWQMTLLFAGSVYAVYYAPSFINYVFFLIPLALFWFSKKDYFWFAYFFVLINSPAYFFYESSGQAANRLPLYSLTSGISFSVFDLFVILSIIKIFKINKFKSFTLSKSLRFLLLYLVFISIPMTILLGMEGSSLLNNVRPFTYYLVVISFYFLIDDIEDIYKFGYVLLPYLLFILFDQFFLITTGKLLISIVDPSTSRIIVDDSITGGIRAIFGGEILVFYIFLFGLQLTQARKYEAFKGLSYLIIFIAFTAVIIAQARTWLVITAVVLFSYLLTNKNAISNLFKLSIISALVIVILFSTQIISVEYFIDKIWPRFGAFFTALKEGNLSEFDTAGSRIKSDWPHSIEGVMQSPILGVGFSGKFRYYVNNDLGFINTILIFGFVGFLFFVNFIFMFFKKLNQYIKHQLQNVDSQVIIKTIKIIFIGMMVGYATTFDFFTVRQVERIFFVSILIASGEIAINHIKMNSRNFFNQHK